jgi:hypothetical protein
MSVRILGYLANCLLLYTLVTKRALGSASQVRIARGPALLRTFLGVFEDLVGTDGSTTVEGLCTGRGSFAKGFVLGTMFVYRAGGSPAVDWHVDIVPFKH